MKVSDILRTTGHYTDDDIRLFEASVTRRKLAKNEIMLPEGQVCKFIYFLIEGSAFQYRRLPDGRQAVDLHVAGEWFTNYQSLISQVPSELTVSAFSESLVLELDLNVVHYLTGRSLAFLQLNKALEGVAGRLQFLEKAMSPNDKYNWVIDQRPELIRTFPLKMLASYLQITPETLSRVRKSMTKPRIS